MIVLELVRGGTAAVLELRGEDVVVLSTLSSPPGSPLEATLGGAETMYPEFAIRLKTLPSGQKPAAPASAPKTPEKPKR